MLRDPSCAGAQSWARGTRKQALCCKCSILQIGLEGEAIADMFMTAGCYHSLCQNRNWFSLLTFGWQAGGSVEILSADFILAYSSYASTDSI